MNPTHNQPTGAPTEPSPAEVLRAAALYLERHGWHQGHFYADEVLPLSRRTSPFPPACAIGAIRIAVAGRRIDNWRLDRETDLAINRAVCVLADHLDIAPDQYDVIYEVGCWNDHATTISEVTTALHAAAQEWDVRHGIPVDHARYPHEPGTLYDCPACEARCYCTDDSCVHCALTAETAMHTPGGAR
jgi:hypothetical protein